MASAPKHLKTMDERLRFEPLSSWQRDKQALLGSDYTIIRPNGAISETPQLVEFDLNCPKPFLPGPNSKIVIRGGFQVKPAQADGSAGTQWRAATRADAAKVCLAPAWFEQLLQDCSIFSQNTKITSHSESRYITPWMNAFLYRLMNKTSKTIIAPQATSHVYGVPEWEKDSWGTEDKTYKEYAENLFDQTVVDFDWTPLCWPFYQDTNHMMTGHLPKIIPLPQMPKLTLRLAFNPDQSVIFRKKVATDKTEYKFSIVDMYIMLEEARLSPIYEKNLMSSKRLLSYSGPSRLQLVEPIPTGSTTYKAKLQDIFLPENLLIVAVPKDIASGSYNFAKQTDKNVFRPHNIKSISVSFQQKQMYIKEPYPTQINDDRFRTKHYLDRLYHPICGIPPNLEDLKEIYFLDGSKKTAYPHCFVNLINFGSQSRLLPALSDESILSQKADLEIDFRFDANGSASDCCYVIWACYNDVAIQYDQKTKVFSNPFGAMLN